MKAIIKKVIFQLACFGLVFVICLGSSLLYAKPATRTITDMAGRKVEVPSVVNRISCIHPIPCHMVWRLAPRKLVSMDKQFKERFIFMSDEEAQKVAALPVTGEFHSGVSREEMLMLKPDVVVSLNKDPDLDKEQEDYAAPVVATSKNNLIDYEASWRFIGQLVVNSKEGNELAGYWEKTMAKVTAQTSKIPEKNKLKVYYAQANINCTVGTKTIMASIIRTAGGINFYDAIPCAITQQENESIVTPMEEVLKWNPDVIITGTAKARDDIVSNPQWANIDAVKNKRVYASLNFERLDGIQSLLGLVWTAIQLYPAQVKLDFEQETRTFYSKIYLNHHLTHAQIYEERN
ncbi:MAG TPA: ABC transporter substrate-binding protein [Firmicutes bacterium]|jgi:iron complex transport system substrate-binding protein|nr:ABC transporter substrate-binding protein [Bacillota bacterium]